MISNKHLAEAFDEKLSTLRVQKSNA